MIASLAELPLSVRNAAPRVGAVMSVTVVRRLLSVAGATSLPPTRTVTGKAGAMMRVLLPRAPPTISSWMRFSALPSSTSSPSSSLPLTGLSPTRILLSTMSPATRRRASVPALKLSALTPVPPNAASAPRLAPTNTVNPRVDPPTCKTWMAAAATVPEASPRM